MITGAHTILYSSYPDADRNFLLEVLKLTNVDVGHGWLIKLGVYEPLHARPAPMH
jgi:hypothetical protein